MIHLSCWIMCITVLPILPTPCRSIQDTVCLGKIQPSKLTQSRDPTAGPPCQNVTFIPSLKKPSEYQAVTGHATVSTADALLS